MTGSRPSQKLARSQDCRNVEGMNENISNEFNFSAVHTDMNLRKMKFIS